MQLTGGKFLLKKHSYKKRKTSMLATAERYIEIQN